MKSDTELRVRVQKDRQIRIAEAFDQISVDLKEARVHYSDYHPVSCLHNLRNALNRTDLLIDAVMADFIARESET